MDYGKKNREQQKELYMCFIDYSKIFDVLEHDKFWTCLNEIDAPPHLIKLIRSLYRDHEATVRTPYGDIDSRLERERYMPRIHTVTSNFQHVCKQCYVAIRPGWIQDWSEDATEATAISDMLRIPPYCMKTRRILNTSSWKSEKKVTVMHLSWKL